MGCVLGSVVVVLVGVMGLAGCFVWSSVRGGRGGGRAAALIL